MSDATNPDAGDFRGTRETKRRDETVMLGQDSLGAMVDEAKAPAESAPAAPVDATGALSGARLIILATGAIVILVVIIALVYSVVS